MRIWSLDPSQLDAKGLVACWRETLLAQKVLQGGTKGYVNHPQLLRFRRMVEPVAVIGRYLSDVADAASERGYNFNRGLIVTPPEPGQGPQMVVTDGQLTHEWAHLLAKVQTRAPEWHKTLSQQTPRLHPLFAVVPGPVEDWEILEDR